MSNRRPNTRPSRGRSIEIGKPEPGHYRTRLWSKGPWAPALIWLEPARDPLTGQSMDRAPVLRCIVNGKEVDPHEVWTRLHPIDERAYRQLVKERHGVKDVTDINESEVRI